MIKDAVWQELQKSWPGLVVARTEFDEFLASRSSTPIQGSKERGPGSPNLEDLYLAFACGRGDGVAIARFTERFAGDIERVRRRFGTRAPAPDEMLSDVHTRLFVEREGRPPRILDYGGESTLSTWLKVVVSRLVLNRLAALKSTEPFEESVLAGLAGTADGPERLLERAQDRERFRALFIEAIRSLAQRERQVLRLAFAERLTIDDLATLYGIHRTTAFRRIQQATARLAGVLRTTARAELGMTEEAYERWCGSLRSALDLSLDRYFESTGQETDTP